MADTNSTARKKPRPQAVPTTLAIDSACCFLLDKQERRIVKRAFKVLEKSAVYRSKAMSTPHAVRDYLKLRMVSLDHEEFHVLWLDAQNRVIAFDALFTGTITQTAIYPREVVKAGLAHNASAVVLAHNHPSGIPEPSEADRLLTQGLKSALALVDIRVLDHFIVAGVLTLTE
ncbi:MAG: DNA repair protein [Propionivibrio sp.]|nr:DNA repair protein [Propionivibrio sp.]